MNTRGVVGQSVHGVDWFPGHVSILPNSIVDVELFHRTFTAVAALLQLLEFPSCGRAEQEHRVVWVVCKCRVRKLYPTSTRSDEPCT
jgi:hypothetical protein